MENLIITALQKLNAQFQEKAEYELQVKTPSDVVKVNIASHWLGKSDYLQVHHLQFHSRSVSETGYKSHFLNFAVNDKITIEDMAYIISTLIEQLQDKCKDFFEDFKREEMLQSQLSLF